MKKTKYLLKSQVLLASLILSQAASFNVHAELNRKTCKIFTADRVFDGNTVLGLPYGPKMAVVIDKGRINQVLPAAEIDFKCRKNRDLGDSTILPGAVESHAHIGFQNVKQDVVLKNGVTTARDVGGLLTPPTGGKGQLRLVNTGPIIQAPHGYPLNLFGGHGDEGEDDHHAATIAVEAMDVDHAIEHVEHIANSGAVAIKVALERGGEHGAPWSGGHGHGGGDTDGPAPGEWPILSKEILEAIVTAAHDKGLPVLAHAGEQEGFDLAVKAGVDEFAHLPCAEISQESIFSAVAAGIRFQTTSDTLSSCHGINANMHNILHAEQHLIEAGVLTEKAVVLYASEIGHDDVPWGINAQELVNNLMSFAGHNPVDFSHVLRTLRGMTSIPGHLIGVQIDEPLLGTLMPGAPADMIAVKGNAIERFKLLENPELVIAGGKVVKNEYK